MGRIARSMDQTTLDDIRTVARIGAVPSILQIVSDTTGLRFAAVARVTQGSWTACAVLDKLDFGLKVGSQLDVATTLCREIRASHEPIVIEKASEDAVFCGHPTPKLYGFESYISVPIIRRDGEVFGTICALDPLPAKLKDGKILRMVELYAQLIAAQLEIEDRLTDSETALASAVATGGQREQFIAMLGHDLRNPLFAIMAGIRGLLRRPPEDKANLILEQMQQSATRMAGLVDDLLDFARARLAGGIVAERRRVETLGAELAMIVDELRSAHPGRTIEADIAIPTAVDCDPRRIGQLFSNLLGNALQHGAPDLPVTVTARVQQERFTLSVANRGRTIEPETLAHIFEPYSRPPGGSKAGLGLGLFIAAEIARAHGGTIAATSDDRNGTAFTVEIPT
jgi:signal transduction histidine kinase